MKHQLSVRALVWVVVLALLVSAAPGGGRAVLAQGTGPQPGEAAPGEAAPTPGDEPVLQAVEAAAGLTMGLRVDRADARVTFDDLSPHSLALAKNGLGATVPFAAYGQDHLYLASFSDNAWSRQVIDSSPGVGRGAFLAVDGQGYLHISYYDETYANLKYASNRSGAWVIETLASHGSLGLRSDIKPDAAGCVHVAYSNDDSQQIFYGRHCAGQGWADTVQQVSMGAAAVEAFAMDIDAQGGAHFLYNDRVSGTTQYYLWYAYRSPGGVWTRTKIGYPVAMYNVALDLVIGPGGYPHIVFGYTDISIGSRIVHGTKPGDTWNYSIMETGKARDISLTYLAASNTMLLAFEAPLDPTYKDRSNLQAREYSSGGTWSNLAGLPADRLVGGGPSITANTSGSPILLYKDDDTGLLNYHFYSRTLPPGWGTGPAVDTSFDLGAYPVILSNDWGNPSVLYYEQATGKLLYTYFDGQAWTMPRIVDQDAAGVSHYYEPSLATSPGGQRAVSYVTDGGALRYGVRSCGGLGVCVFTFQTIDTGLTDQSSKLVFSSLDRPNILYHKSGKLIHAYWSGASWIIETINTGTLGTYEDISAAFDSGDVLHVAFREYMDHPYYVKGTPGHAWTWTSPYLLDSENYTMSNVALALFPSGCPAVAYVVNNQLKLFTSGGIMGGGCSWSLFSSKEVLDTGAANSSRVSLVIDAQGRRHLSYSLTDGFMRYGVRDNKGWVWADVAGGSEWWQSISMDVRPNGLPVIAGHDPVSGDLMVAWGLGQLYLPWVRR